MINYQSMETMELSDAQLVASSLAGSREAFGRIVAKYQSLICSLNYSATGDLNQSEDLAQETFLTAWKDLGKLREPTKLRAWLCTISRNLTCDALRKAGREPSHAAESLDEIHDAPAPEPAPMDRAISREEQDILWRSIEKIPDLYREPLVLFYREHQSIETVAKNLELSEDAVKQRLSRGRKLLHEQVLAFVEGALERTSPGKVFTISVLAALPALTLSAKAATLGAAAAKGGGAAKAAGVMGMFGVVLSPLMVFFGNYLGYRMSMDAAQSEEERVNIRAVYRKILGIAFGFFVAFGALAVWICRSRQDHTVLFSLLIIGLMVIFLATTFAFAISTLAKRKRWLGKVLADDLHSQFPQPIWEYRSAWSFLGLPLVHIRVGDRFSPLKKPVKAWIASGDCAIGGLLAFGGMAIAPISVGGVAIGLFAIGGLTLGMLSFGGLALGIWSDGGLAAGWQAFGGIAAAWDAAFGGVAVAKHYAMGGGAFAAQANTDLAKNVIESNRFFRCARVMVDHSLWINLIWVTPMLIFQRLTARARREKLKSS